MNKAVRYHWNCGRCGHTEESSVLAVRLPSSRSHYIYKAVTIFGRVDNKKCPKCGVGNLDGWKVRGQESYEPDGMVVW